VSAALKDSIDTVKTESKGALDTVMANLMASLKDQGKKLLADLPGIAKGAAQALLDAAEKKRKELQAKEIVKINVKLEDLVPDLAYDANKDGKVTCEDFLNEVGDLSPAATLRFLLAVGALGLLGVGGVAGSAVQKNKLAGKTAVPPKTS
jgi:hypothetical protein